MTFNKACPSGNVMVEQQDNSQWHKCEECYGTGVKPIPFANEGEDKTEDICPSCAGRCGWWD